MKYTKLSITLEPEVASELREVAAERGLSSFVNDAVRHRLQPLRIKKLLDDMDTEAGPVPDELQRHIDALPWPE